MNKGTVSIPAVLVTASLAVAPMAARAEIFSYDGISYDYNSANNTLTYSGNQVSGTVSFVDNGTTTTINGSETVNGTSSSFSCTVDNTTDELVGPCSSSYLSRYYQSSATDSTTVMVERNNAILQQNAQVVANNEVKIVNQTISSRIRSVLGQAVRSRQVAAADGAYGLAAGDAKPAFGAWADGSYSFQAIDKNPLGDSHVSNWAGLTGIDYAVNDWLLVGINAGYLHADVKMRAADLSFNSGSTVIGPYAAFILSDNYTIDINSQYTHSAVSMRYSGSNPYTGDYDADRFSTSANVNGYWVAAPVNLSAFVGWSYGYERGGDARVYGLSNFTDAKRAVGAGVSRFQSARLGGEVSWPLDEAWEPFVSAEADYQLTHLENGTRFNPFLGVGTRYRANDNLTLGCSVSGDFMGDDRTLTTQINARMTF